jgi:hypothetical protein
MHPIRHSALAFIALVLTWARAFAEDAVTGLSPDQRPTLLVVAPPSELMLAHHAHPLNPNAAERLALRLGLLLAAPIIRDNARESRDPLPPPWKSAQPDRGFVSDLKAALDRSQANWPWRALRFVGSTEAADGVVGELKGEDVAVAVIGMELTEHTKDVQFSADVTLTVIRAAGSAREMRTVVTIRHLSERLPATRDRAGEDAAAFRAGGTLDQMVNGAALDLSRIIAVTVARAATPPPAGQAPSRRFGDLTHKPRCAECRSGDPVLHEEPGRVWVAPFKSPGTILSLPLA